MQDNVSVKVIVSGRVQGVGFRYYVYEVMQNYPVTGYVRNLRSGQVEVLIEGDSDVIEALLPIIAKGPHSSHVTDIDVERIPYSGEFREFNIKL